jgi:dimethylglycine dehydrogenase
VGKRLVQLEVFGNETFDAMGQEPIRTADGERVGRTTSGGFGHCLGKSLAMAYVSAEALESGKRLKVKLMNEWFPAQVVKEMG